MTTKLDTRQMVLLSLLTAIVVVLQLLGSFVRLGPFSVSLVLMPITLGAALIGPWGGAWLGLVFGGVVLLSGDAAFFFPIDPIGTVVVVLTRGIVAGLAAGFVYRLLVNKNKTAAAGLAATVCPIVNTGLFVVGMYVFFLPTVTQWGMYEGFTNAAEYIFLGLIGANFIFELVLNIVFIPIIIRLIRAREVMR